MVEQRLNDHNDRISELERKIQEDEATIRRLNDLVAQRTFLANDNILGVSKVFAILAFALILALFKSEVLIRLAEIIFK